MRRTSSIQKPERNVKISEVELLPPPESILRPGVDKAILDRLAKQKAAEILAEPAAAVLEPFFCSRRVAYELKRLQTVPEQRKFSVAFARYGCMICATREAFHAGNGLCPQCRALWCGRFAQIIAEGMTGQAAKPARGSAGAERHLLSNRPLGAPHRTFYQSGARTTPQAKAAFRRVANRLNVDPSHVRAVARGQTTSQAVSAALDEEWEQLQKAAEEKPESTHGRQPGTRAALEKARERRTAQALAEKGISPELAAVTLEAAKEGIMACMPKSKSRAMHAAALFELAVVSSLSTGRNALAELLSAGKIERIGEGTCGTPYRYYQSPATPEGARSASGRLAPNGANKCWVLPLGGNRAAPDAVLRSSSESEAASGCPTSNAANVAARLSAL